MNPKIISSVFEAEHLLIERCSLLDKEASHEETHLVLEELAHAYMKLLRQTEKITKVGDSIQRKLVKAREEILIKNQHLMEAQKQILHKEKMVAMNTLVQGLAHEICNPLNFINNFAHLNLELCTEIKESINSEPINSNKVKDLNDCLDDLNHGALIIREHGLRAASIVKSMGKVIGVGRGRQGLRVSENPIDLMNNFSTPVLRHFTRTLLGRLEVVRSFGPAIPNMEVVVEDIGTVFTQLTTNACEALCARIRVEPEFQPILRFSCQLDETSIHIHIDDNGDGIPELNLAKIFTPFFTTRESASNLGLGLSTSYDIVLNGYNGEILLVSDFEGFTRFTIVLPLAPKAVDVA